MTRNTRGILAVVGGAAAVFWPGALTYTYPGIMTPYWEHVFGAGKGTIGTALFVALPMAGTFMFIAGKLQEKFGTRWMTRIGALVCTAALFVSAFATNIWMIALWAAGNGLAVALVYIPSITCVQRWWPQRKGLMTGIVSLSFGGSAVLTAPLCAHLMKSIGYVRLNLVTSAVTLIMGLLAAQFTESPETAIDLSMPASSAAAAAVDEEPDVSLTAREALQTKSFWFLWGTWALQGSAGACMFTYAVLFGLWRGFSYSDSVLILTCFNLTSGLSRVIAAYLSDLIGRTLLMSITFMIAGAAYLGLASIPGRAGVCALAAIVGFSFGAMFSVSAPLAADCFGLKHFGAIFGLVFTAYGFIAGMIGSSLAGYALDLTGSFRVVFGYMAISSVLSGILIRFVVMPARTSARPKAATVADPA